MARPVTARPLSVGVVEWALDDEMTHLVTGCLRALGHDARTIAPDAPLTPALDAVFMLGPFGPSTPLLLRLAALPARNRPLLIWWMTEQLWNPAVPYWLAHGLAEARSGVERLLARTRPSRQVRLGGVRFRYYGDLLWLRRQRVLSVLAVPSAWLAAFLRRRGIETLTAPLGSHPNWEAPAAAQRDIPVLWIGKPGSARRRRNVERIRRALARRGIAMKVVDGEQHPPVFGDERAGLLRRTAIILNLLRRPWDSNFLRFFLAAPNRAMVISEPQLPHYAVIPGTHLVEAPLERIDDEICRYLADAPARERIAQQAYELVTSELTLARGVAAIMTRARLLAEARP